MLRSRSIFWNFFAGLLLVSLSGSCWAARRNVLLLTFHALNQRIGPYADRFPEDSVAATPNINRLANRAIVFDRAYCQACLSGPSRLSWLSGLYPETSGVIRETHRIRNRCPDAPSLAGHLKSQGYWTASAGRVYPQSVDDGDKLNWDAVVRHPDEELPVARAARKEFIEQHRNFDEPGSRVLWRKTLAGLCTQTRGERKPGYGPSGLQDSGHADGLNARWAAELIEQRDWGSQPFFIAVGFAKPHVPLVVPKKYFDLYDPESLLLPTRSPRPLDAASKYALTKRYIDFGFDYERENLPLRRAYTHAYLSCVSFVDAQIGILLDALDSADLAEDTLVLCVSGNGFLLGEYRMWGKEYLYENCLRVPLIISAPGWTDAPGRSPAICELIDIFPTVCEWCGVETPEMVQGRSLATVLKDPHSEHKPMAYTVAYRGGVLGRSVCTADWRYTEWGGPVVAELLDSTEQENRIDDDSLRDVKTELRKHLHIASMNAQCAPQE